MTKACSVTCGLLWCQNIKGEQTSLSRGLRVTAVALGIILAVGGSLILWGGIPGLAQLGSAGGWTTLIAGVVLITLGVSIQCVHNKTDKGKLAEQPISTNANNANTDTVQKTEKLEIKHAEEGKKVHKEKPKQAQQEAKKQTELGAKNESEAKRKAEEEKAAFKLKADLEAKNAEKEKRARELAQKPSTLQEQAFHAALSLECQRNNLPNVVLMLEQIKLVMENLSEEELIRISGQVTDQVLNEWVTAVSKYLDDRWAWPAASGKYSVIRQLITDPNLNAPLQDPTFILAIFGRSQLGNPITLLTLNVAEMLIAGFRDQHPALLECQPYNNAFFVEEINIVHDQAHEERLLKGYLMRKECSFMQVMQAIEAAAKEIGISVVGNAASSSHFDDIYGSKLWENGNIVACFRQLKQLIDSEKKFVVQGGHAFVGSYGQSLQGFLALCRILYPKSVIVDANPNFSFVSSTDLAEKIAHHPTVLLEYDICHLWYDVMHLKAMFAGQSRKYHFKDGQFAMIDIVEKILLHIQQVGLKPENAITAQQLYLRLYALADLK